MSEQTKRWGRNRIPALEDCPKCGAPKGQPCVYLWPKGNTTPIKGVHVVKRPAPPQP